MYDLLECRKLLREHTQVAMAFATNYRRATFIRPSGGHLPRCD